MTRLLRLMAALVSLAVAAAVAILAVAYLAREAVLPFQAPAVGIVEVRGVIRDADDVVDALKDFRSSSRVGAVVLRIDSPGGEVAPSQEIYSAVEKVRQAKPIIASLGNLAASGGYYVASACDAIVANPGTLTGSIGVIMAVHNVEDLVRRIGATETVVKSGPYKDIGNPLRPLTPDEQAILQGMVDDVYGQFVAAVARGRGMDEAAVRAVADGRVYSGAQARAHGLVDELGGLEDAVALAARRAGIEGEPRRIRVRASRRPWWFEALARVAGLGPTGWPAVDALDGLLFLHPGPGLGLR
jgi:protease-4